MRTAIVLTLLMATAAMGTWDANLPADTTAWDLRDDYTRDNFAALESLLGIGPSGVDLNSPVVLNVKTYNATGDGVTDDTAAMQAAFAAAKANDVPFYMPAGTYKITTTIGECESGMVICGAGSRKTVIVFDDSAAEGVFEIAKTSSFGSVTMSDFQITGTNSTGYGIDIGLADTYHSIGNVFKNIYIAGGLARGISHDRGWSSQFNMVSIMGCTDNVKIGMGNDLTFYRCRFDNAVSHAFWFEEGWSIGLENCVLQNSTDTLVQIDGGGAITFDTCYFENANTRLFEVGAAGSTVYGFEVHGGWVYGLMEEDNDGTVVFDDVHDLIFEPEEFRFSLNGQVYDSGSTRWKSSVTVDANGLASVATLQVGLDIAEPTAYWNLDDDAADTTVADSSDNSYDMTSQGNNTEDMQIDDAGIVSGALEFDGSTDYAKLGSMPFSGTSGTVMFWMRTDIKTSSTWAHCLAAGDEASSNYSIAFGRWEDQIRYSQENNDTIDDLRGSTDLRVGRWYHVAFTCDGSTVTCYLNGEIEALTAETGANNGDWWDDTTNLDNVAIGALERSTVSAYWDGDIDEVRVYAAELTRTQVGWIYERQRLGHDNVTDFPGSIQTGSLYITEAATASADAAGEGQVWVKTATPNELWFTDDAGTDVQLGVSKTVTVDLSSAEIKALAASPKELVASQGAGTVIEFVSAILVLDYGSNVFTESDDNLAIEYDSGGDAAASQTIEMTGFIDQSADTITNALPKIDAMDAAADIVNKNLALVNLGDEITGNAGADNTLRVIVTYRVHNSLGL